MRVLITGTTYYPALNGQAIFMVNLAEGIAAGEHDVCALYPEPRQFSGRRNGVRLETVRSHEFKFIGPESYHPLRSTARVRQVLDDFRPDIVHIHDHYPLSATVVREAKRRGIKTFGTNHFSPVHVEPFIPGSVRFKPLVERMLWAWLLHLYRQLEFVTAPSQYAINELRRQGLQVPAVAISCGTSLARFHPDPSFDRVAWRSHYGLDPQAAVFVSVGRVERVKRIEVMVQALHLLGRTDIQLALAGDGAFLEHLKSIARALNLGDRVRFLGRLPNEELPTLLNSADVFVMTSETETLSIASLEAMASGLPVLLANASALPELVTPGVNGYLFTAGDPVDAARYMSRLADQPGQRVAMGRASRQRAQAHSLDLTLQRYETLYRQILESPVRVSLPVTKPRTRPRPANAKREL
jgi:1,2-diacylglycerol 3-alpha-glucosyltransferase